MYKMEENEGNWKKFTRYEPVQKCHFSRNYFSYSGNASRGYYNKRIGSFRPMNHFNQNRGRGRGGILDLSKLSHPNRNRKKAVIISEGSKELCPWSEEAKEEERKRQLSDTAKKLMSKLKMWSTRKKEGEEDGKMICNEKTSSLLLEKEKKSSENSSNGCIQDSGLKSDMTSSDFSVKLSSQLTNSNERQLRKANRLEQETMKGNSSQNTAKHKTVCNKSQNQLALSEGKQKKIQQNIIGELMNMPKDNLKKVLVNPKIHPKIECGMAQMVKENRLILAQKFRNLAESKINDQGHFVCSKFIDDMENLLDPDLAVDLCQLPPELIKQMGDIFQLDFDGITKETEVQENCESLTIKNEAVSDVEEEWCNSSKSDFLCFGISESEIKNNHIEINNVKIENQSMDIVEHGKIEDENSENNFCNTFNNGIRVKSEVLLCDSSLCVVNNTNEQSLPESIVEKSLVDEVSIEYNLKTGDGVFKCNNDQPNKFDSNSCLIASNMECETIVHNSGEDMKILRNSGEGKDNCSMENDKKSDLTTSPLPWIPQSGKRLKTLRRCSVREKINTRENETFSQDAVIGEKVVNKSIEVQTDISLIEAEHSPSIRREFKIGDNESSFLHEIEMIDNLVHRLNQRRFLLFLKLLNLDSCVRNENKLKTSLLQAVTNSDLKLINQLKKRRVSGSDCKLRKKMLSNGKKKKVSYTDSKERNMLGTQREKNNSIVICSNIMENS